MLEPLWGLKTLAAFDVWTIEHILTGLSVGNIYKKRTRKNINRMGARIRSNHSAVIRFELVGVLFLAYLWEAVESYMEMGLIGARVEWWLQGSEFWMNRLITDPLMMVVGYYIAKRFPKAIIPARILSITWLLVHVFIFPHSMYLHYIF